MTDESRLLARETGLRHVNDAEPGMSRRRQGCGFNYFDAEGRRIRDPQVAAAVPGWPRRVLQPTPRQRLCRVNLPISCVVRHLQKRWRL